MRHRVVGYPALDPAAPGDRLELGRRVGEGTGDDQLCGFGWWPAVGLGAQVAWRPGWRGEHGPGALLGSSAPGGFVEGVLAGLAEPVVADLGHREDAGEEPEERGQDEEPARHLVGVG